VPQFKYPSGAAPAVAELYALPQNICSAAAHVSPPVCENDDKLTNRKAIEMNNFDFMLTFGLVN
jgi:hypothetical protein